MLSVHTCICIVGIVLALGTTSIAGASDVTSATDKLKDEHFQEALSRDHDGVIVRLDVDADAYLKTVRENTDLSDARRQELLQQGAARLLKAKIELLEGSRFPIHQNLEFGSEVVILVDGMSGVCDACGQSPRKGSMGEFEMEARATSSLQTYRVAGRRGPVEHGWQPAGHLRTVAIDCSSFTSS